MSGGDCFTPVEHTLDATAQREAVLDAHRAVRFDGLLQLIEEVQRRRSIAEVAQVVATRWKHCADVNSWRLLCVYAGHCALVQAQASQTQVQELSPDQLETFDAQLWAQRRPHHWSAKALADQRPQLPGALADARGVGFSMLPLQQGASTIGMLCVLSHDKPFDLLDRKFNSLVGGAMATRILAILTEQRLTAELMQAQRQLLEQRQAGIMGRLVNGVAHEINMPLGVQISACDALAGMLAEYKALPGALHATQDLQDIQDAVALVAQQARRAARIVKRLKQISAASVAGPRLPTLLREELELIAQSHTGLQITTACPAGLQLTLDRNALATVLGELLDNAHAHGGGQDGGPVQLLATEEATRITIRVCDRGPGFAPEQHEHFFEPFFTSRLNQGHIGIGGYIAQNVARDALAAVLELQSVPGYTTVALHFPKS